MNNILLLEDNVVFAASVEQAILELPLICKVYKATTLKQGLEMLLERDYLAFIIDIGLPDGSGYDFIQHIKKNPMYDKASVVILTGQQETTTDILSSFNNQLCDMYFQKPFIMQEFKEKVGRLIENGSRVDESRRLSIKLKQSTVFFDYQDIVYIETNNKQTTIHCVQGPYNIGRYSLSRLDKELTCDKFKRIHRSYIVNLHYVREIIRGTNDCILMFENRVEKIPIGTNYKDVIHQS